MAVTIDKDNNLIKAKNAQHHLEIISKEITINDLSSQDTIEIGDLGNYVDELAEYNHLSVNAIVTGVSSGSGELTLEGSPDRSNYAAYDATEFLDSTNTVTVDGNSTLYRFSIEIFTDKTIRLSLDKSTGSLSGGTIKVIVIAKRIH